MGGAQAQPSSVGRLDTQGGLQGAYSPTGRSKQQVSLQDLFHPNTPFFKRTVIAVIAAAYIGVFHFSLGRGLRLGLG
jgi:hypothetical protein